MDPQRKGTHMTHEQRARELVARWEHGDEIHRQWLRDIATPHLAKAFAEVRRETLNDARNHDVGIPNFDDLSPEARDAALSATHIQRSNFRNMLNVMISETTPRHTVILTPPHRLPSPNADYEHVIQTLAQSANVDRYTTKGKAYWEAVQRLFGR